MIQHPAFRVEPWSLHETSLSLDVLAQTESLFALSNGVIGLRGNLDEGEPHGLFDRIGPSRDRGEPRSV